MSIGIIDYGAGNLHSVKNAVENLGFHPQLIRQPDDFPGLTHLILPGVGSFGDSMQEIQSRHLADPIRQWIESDRPFFGICVGYQLLFTSGEESPGITGLDVFPGVVKKFPNDGRKIPHMGWNAAQPTTPNDPIWQNLASPPYFYFVHSYYPQPEDASLVAMTTDYEDHSFPSAIRRGALVATQFHPEKSQQAGLQLLQNFLA